MPTLLTKKPSLTLIAFNVPDRFIDSFATMVVILFIAALTTWIPIAHNTVAGTWFCTKMHYSSYNVLG